MRSDFFYFDLEIEQFFGCKHNVLKGFKFILKNYAKNRGT
nr:MAG TPA: hypothetical protein [Bacteriophage sp.]